MFVVPICANIPAPNDEVATKVLTLPAPPTQAYPLANEAVNVLDADTLPVTDNKLLMNVKFEFTFELGALNVITPPNVNPFNVRAPAVNDAVDTKVVLFPAPPTNINPCAKDAVIGPLISNEPVI